MWHICVNVIFVLLINYENYIDITSKRAIVSLICLYRWLYVIVNDLGLIDYRKDAQVQGQEHCFWLSTEAVVIN